MKNYRGWQLALILQIGALMAVAAFGAGGLVYAAIAKVVLARIGQAAGQLVEVRGSSFMDDSALADVRALAPDLTVRRLAPVLPALLDARTLAEQGERLQAAEAGVQRAAAGMDVATDVVVHGVARRAAVAEVHAVLVEAEIGRAHV